tara:strand:+ start:813 stop:1274 length:462 start_codon:yes stop_codon:yes gene_type:complete
MNDDAPTPETLSKGVYKLVRLHKKSSRVWVNQEPTPILRAFNRDKLTFRQFEAAKIFEARYTAYWARSSGRNILDQTPRGKSADDDSLQERALKAKERLIEIETCSGMTKSYLKVLVSVCVDYEKIGDCRPTRKRYSYLCSGLDCVANYLKIR